MSAITLAQVWSTTCMRLQMVEPVSNFYFFAEFKNDPNDESHSQTCQCCSRWTCFVSSLLTGKCVMIVCWVMIISQLWDMRLDGLGSINRTPVLLLYHNYPMRLYNGCTQWSYLIRACCRTLTIQDQVVLHPVQLLCWDNLCDPLYVQLILNADLSSCSWWLHGRYACQMVS